MFQFLEMGCFELFLLNQHPSPGKYADFVKDQSLDADELDGLMTKLCDRY